MGYWNITRLLTAMSGIDVNKPTINRESPLIAGSKSGHNEVVKILIDAGAVPDELGGCGKSPLAYAVEHDHQAVVKTLLERGANPDKNRDKLGTDLFTAILCGEDEVVVRLLLEAGADPNVINDKGQTALDYANEVCRGQWLKRTEKIIKDAGGREGRRRND